MDSNDKLKKYHHRKPQEQVNRDFNRPPAGYDEEDEINYTELIRHFWSDRYLIAKIAGVVVIIGLFIALFSGVEYKTDAVILPEIQSSSSSAENLLNKYGGLLGIGRSSVQSGPQSTIPPQLYPRIVESIPFQAELMNTPITFASYDTTVTPHHFFHEVYSPSVLSYVKSYTLGLPGKIRGVFSEEEISESHAEIPLSIIKRDSVYNLTKNQWITIGQLQERITVGIDETIGVVTLNAEMPDAQAAAELGKVGLRILKNYVREYRTQNAAKNLEYIQEQVERARKDFETAQQNLTTFRDNNINLTSAQAQSQEQELQSEYDLAFNTYNSLQQRLEQAKLKVQEQTPVFSVLQPITIPQEKSTPQRKLIMIFAVILGVIIGMGYSLVQTSDLFNEIKGKKTADYEISA